MSRNPSKSTHWVSYAVVQGEYKLVTSAKGEYKELYHISSDVAEGKNLADSKPELVASLSKLIDDWKATLPDGPSGDVFSSLREE